MHGLCWIADAFCIFSIQVPLPYTPPLANHIKGVCTYGGGCWFWKFLIDFFNMYETDMKCKQILKMSKYVVPIEYFWVVKIILLYLYYVCRYILLRRRSSSPPVSWRCCFLQCSWFVIVALVVTIFSILQNVFCTHITKTWCLHSSTAISSKV